MNENNKILIILAAGRIANSLVGKFGPIRTSLIPYRNKPLFLSIIDKFSNFQHIFLAIHKDDITSYDYAKLVGHSNVSIVLIDGDSQLNHALLEVLKSPKFLDYTNHSFQVIFGDTLVSPLQKRDFIGVTESQIDYMDWSTVIAHKKKIVFNTPGKKNQLTVAGYFGFADSNQISIELQKSDFFSALSRYFETFEEETLVEVTDWHDYGRLRTFHESRISGLITRHFNSITFQPNNFSVIKRSNHSTKIKAEINWYQELKKRKLSHLAPAIIEMDSSPNETAYRLEYIATPTVAETYICGNKTLGYWNRFFMAVQKNMQDYYDPIVKNTIFDQTLIKEAYISRLENRCKLLKQQRPDLFTSPYDFKGTKIILNDFLKKMHEWLSTYEPKVVTFVHGDLFFGNMFFIEETGRLILVDPRGIESKNHRYDFGYEIAKLSHSIFGGYDFLASNLFEIHKKSNCQKLSIPWTLTHKKIKEIGAEFFKDIQKEFQFDTEAHTKLASFLFVSLAPLHQENLSRQTAAILRALQLWEESEAT